MFAETAGKGITGKDVYLDGRLAYELGTYDPNTGQSSFLITVPGRTFNYDDLGARTIFASWETPPSFPVGGGVHQYKLFTTDGTGANTKTLFSATTTSRYQSFSSAHRPGDAEAYFCMITGPDDAPTSTIYQTDGTTEGTRSIITYDDVGAGVDRVNNDTLFVSRYSVDIGQQIVGIDRSTGASRIVLDGGPDEQIRLRQASDHHVYYTNFVPGALANERNEFWAIDERTNDRVKLLAAADISIRTLVDQTLVFLAIDAAQRGTIYVSDGTLAGTQAVTTLNSYQPGYFGISQVGDTVYYVDLPAGETQGRLMAFVVPEPSGVMAASMIAASGLLRRKRTSA